jgi:hypothetical protein
MARRGSPDLAALAAAALLPMRVNVDEVEPIEVGPGCLRRDLPATNGVRVWVVDMAPGSRWPSVDVHDETGEEVYVVSGEVIEGDARFGPGTYLFFRPHSRHRPRTETGVRLFGFNVAPTGSPAQERSEGDSLRPWGPI